jgi:hypothetical protein
MCKLLLLHLAVLDDLFPVNQGTSLLFGRLRQPIQCPWRLDVASGAGAPPVEARSLSRLAEVPGYDLAE